VNAAQQQQGQATPGQGPQANVSQFDLMTQGGGAGGQTRQYGIPLGPEKKTEAQIKGEAIQSGVTTSVQTLMEGGTRENPFPILDELGQVGNSVGANVPYGRAIMSGRAQKAYDALKNIAQNYIYALSGQQAPETEVLRAMQSVTPNPFDGPDAKAGKQARLGDMIATINSRAQGPGGQDHPMQAPQPGTFNPADPMNLRRR
jgi:hypothetical protein